MNPEEKRLLEQTAALALENNKLLKSMRRSARMGKVFHILYWVLIVVLSIAAYYYIQPYIQAAQGVYSDAQGAIENIRETSE